MPKRKPYNQDAPPLLDELRSIEACSPEEPVDKAASLCLLRVVAGLDGPTWSSLSVSHGLEHWHAVPLPGPLPRAEVLAQALGHLAASTPAPGLRGFLRMEIERSRACQVPLALALIQPDAPELPAAALLHGLLELAQSLTRSFDHAALLGGERLALVFSGSPLTEAERMVGAMLRRMRTQSPGSSLLCSAGLAGYGGCVELSPDEFLERAMQALENARGLGGNRLEVAAPVDVCLASRDTLVRASEKHFLFTGKKAGDT